MSVESDPERLGRSYSQALGIWIARFREAQGVIRELEDEKEEKDTVIVALAEALAFYAEPETYNAIFIWPDPPAGEFMEDFSEDHGDPFYERPMPGAKARTVLRANSEAILPLLPAEATDGEVGT